MMTPASALVVMAKAPVAGQVKTRLLAVMSAEEAAELSRCLLIDQLAHLCGLAVADLYLAFAPAEARPLMKQLVPSAFSLLPQQGHELGERMTDVFESLFAAQYRNIVLIGGDLAPVPLNFLEEAFRLLESPAPRVVLGPARDGGYYLVGLNGPKPEMFAGMTWSHERVLAETRAKLASLDIEEHLLPVWFDIDTPEDLRYFQSALDSKLIGASPNTLNLLGRLNQIRCGSF